MLLIFWRAHVYHNNIQYVFNLIHAIMGQFNSGC